MSRTNRDVTPEDMEYEEKSTNFWKETASTLIYIVVITGIFFLIQYFLFIPVTVEGDSMEPTLQHSDRLILNKVSSIDRFDIVVFPAPDEPDTRYIKRVIGVPGDEIEYRQDQLYINGELFEEPYLEDYQPDETFNSYITGNFNLESLYGVNEVPPNSYFVLGDNRLNSRDSRSFGFVSEETLTGEARFRFWPFDKFGSVYGPEHE